MTPFEIEWAGERLILLPEKAVSWPRTASLIVTDLHLGKAAAFRRSGIPVPESATSSDLDRLDALLLAQQSSRLIILGDFFHSAIGRQPEMMDVVAEWCKKKPALEIILVPGNHDVKAGAPPSCWNIRDVAEGWSLPPFSFHHRPAAQHTHVIAGHLHPAISLREKFGGGMRAPCFWFQEHCAVLPAFGSFTGMHNVRPARHDRIFAIGHGNVIEVTA